MLVRRVLGVMVAVAVCGALSQAALAQPSKQYPPAQGPGKGMPAAQAPGKGAPYAGGGSPQVPGKGSPQVPGKGGPSYGGSMQGGPSKAAPQG